VTLVTLLFLLLPAQAQTLTRSPWNGRPLEVETPDAYTILIGGHLYGHGESPDPASTLVDWLRTKPALADVAFFALGDLTYRPTPENLDRFEAAVVDPLEMPFFNAPGNHDLHGTEYARRYAPTYYQTRIGPDVFLVGHAGLLEPSPQRAFFLEALEEAASSPQVRYVFILTHRLMWAVDDPRYRAIAERRNLLLGYPDEGQFTATLLPQVKRAAKRKRVFWFSGDLGKHTTYYRDRHPTQGVTYVAVGLWDRPEDRLIRVSISESGVEFTPVPLAPDPPGRTPPSSPDQPMGPASQAGLFALALGLLLLGAVAARRARLRPQGEPERPPGGST
jgi:hypothetical protein